MSALHRLSVLIFRDGQPLCERLARSKTKTPQEMADWFYAHANEGITFRFLGDYGALEPTPKDPNSIKL